MTPAVFPEIDAKNTHGGASNSPAGRPTSDRLPAPVDAVAVAVAALKQRGAVHRFPAGALDRSAMEALLMPHCSIPGLVQQRFLVGCPHARSMSTSSRAIVVYDVNKKTRRGESAGSGGSIVCEAEEGSLGHAVGVMSHDVGLMYRLVR